MKGKDLHRAIKQSGITLDELVRLSGIPKRTISYLYKKTDVEAHYIEAIKKALPNIAEDSKRDASDSIESDTNLKKTIKDQRLTLLEQKVKLLEFQVNYILECKSKPIKKPKKV